MRWFLLIIVSVVLLSGQSNWGFFGHRRINYLATFTLPPEMLRYYKKNIDYLSEHAVDADKRRYASKFEAPRHYIDLDHWGEAPFKNLPRDWFSVLLTNTAVLTVSPGRDTLQVIGRESFTLDSLTRKVVSARADLELKAYRDFFYQHIFLNYYEDNWALSCDSLSVLLQSNSPCVEAFAVDRFSEHGILPYYLPIIQKKLTEAFRQKDANKILRLSADLGHYIGDASVPLHTTKNYNGQLSNQNGLHAFWESRIPELLADSDFDFFVGKAEYIREVDEFFWDIVLSSHRLVPEVLRIEKELSQKFPRDQQYCYDERLGQTVFLPCREYTIAYDQAMQGMVEERMRLAILAVGSAWYTAWVDAGSPNLDQLDEPVYSKQELEQMAEEEKKVREGKILGREHTN
jgi:hypothetical protein